MVRRLEEKDVSKILIIQNEALGRCVKEDFIKSEDACAFLTSLAKEKKVRTDKKLFSTIEIDKIYLAGELQVTFDEWYNAKLKSKFF